MLIQQVILENFMSYEYARVPLKNGVNIVCGPNGSGKSSLLLAMSVAMGQTYTERSKKLSDLIRWGNDRARVTLVLDNTKRCQNRAVPKYNKDQIFLTRVIRKDGNYWFELENKAATKSEVERLLSKLGVDPDNILIIMHQNMVEQFTILSPQEKLRMVEAAVGLEPYRENVVQAQKKLTRILSQEDSISKLLETAEQTLNYWRGQYDRYQEKKQLQLKRRFCERELVWAEVTRRENTVKDLEIDRKKEENNLKQIEDEATLEKTSLRDCTNGLDEIRNEQAKLFDLRLNLEREKGKNESVVSMCGQLFKETAILETKNETQASLKLLRTESIRELMHNAQEELAKLQSEILASQERRNSFDVNVAKLSNTAIETRVRLALLDYRTESIMSTVQKLDTELVAAKTRLDETVRGAEQTGSRIAVLRDVNEILDEIRTTEGHLAALSDVSEDIERMYESYSKLYLELKEKARLVAENREKALEEVKTRMHSWREVMKTLLDRVSLEYQKILGQAQALGEVGLTDEHDIESAGLEIMVGFKGGKPVPLDAYTQSGGERTTATMSFLLALQQHVRSPFRAVDEYDIHMDPRNREVIAKLLISSVHDGNAQYIVITPSQITFAKDEVNIITVQNVEGKSVIREVA